MEKRKAWKKFSSALFEQAESRSHTQFLCSAGGAELLGGTAHRLHSVSRSQGAGGRITKRQCTLEQRCPHWKQPYSSGVHTVERGDRMERVPLCVCVWTLHCRFHTLDSTVWMLWGLESVLLFGFYLHRFVCFLAFASIRPAIWTFSYETPDYTLDSIQWIVYSPRTVGSTHSGYIRPL